MSSSASPNQSVLMMERMDQILCIRRKQQLDMMDRQAGKFQSPNGRNYRFSWPSAQWQRV